MASPLAKNERGVRSPYLHNTQIQNTTGTLTFYDMYTINLTLETRKLVDLIHLYANDRQMNEVVSVTRHCSTASANGRNTDIWF